MKLKKKHKNGSDRAVAIAKALEYISKPIVIDREDMFLFGILLANHLNSNTVKCDDPGLAWLSLADAYVEYTLIKDSEAQEHPENVVEVNLPVNFIQTPLEKVFTKKYLGELESKGWLPEWLVKERQKARAQSGEEER